jgi:hypothetical protein
MKKFKKVTKRPKKTKVKYKEFTTTYLRVYYQCPTCHTCFESDFPSKRVTRFICSCGQELIVDKGE